MERPNLSYIHSLSGGDKAFEEKLLTIIKSEFPEEKKVYFENIESLNFIEASENVHKLKHKISILGLEKSYEIAAEFETNLREENIHRKKDFDSILQIITDYLKKI